MYSKEQSSMKLMWWIEIINRALVGNEEIKKSLFFFPLKYNNFNSGTTFINTRFY